MGLKQKITSGTELRSWTGTIPVAFRYTAGVAGERFFQVLRKTGRLSVTRCAACGVTYLPPRVYCRECLADLTTAWDEVAGRGTVATFTVVHRDLQGRPLATPRVIGFIQIDGTDGGLLAPLELAPSEVHIGRRVEMVLKAPRSRRAALGDILHFK